jgi:hypothetical protein
MSGPWGFDESLENCRKASAMQEASERAVKESAHKAAVAQEQYAVALAKEIVRQHDEDGRAWTVCGDIARGDPKVARLRRERDINEGVREAMVQAAWRRAADRKDAQRFADWSQRREMADGHYA